MKGLSLFIPVYNEAQLLEPNLARLRVFLEALNLPFEIIVGSNGSLDATVAIGRGLAQADRRLIFFHLEAKGPGAAFREGVRRARFDYIITQDMDLSVDLGFIPLALAALDECDLVIGSKRLGAQRRSWVRIVGSGAY
ncbi:MAG: glycosyltransferase family 2 protein, partial [Deltaproteobacteria bacterium]|nr:glycosyltransferase family 2 protein [Deltaproteobacteria bacterium]